MLIVKASVRLRMVVEADGDAMTEEPAADIICCERARNIEASSRCVVIPSGKKKSFVVVVAGAADVGAAAFRATRLFIGNRRSVVGIAIVIVKESAADVIVCVVMVALCNLVWLPS